MFTKKGEITFSTNYIWHPTLHIETARFRGFNLEERKFVTVKRLIIKSDKR